MKYRRSFLSIPVFFTLLLTGLPSAVCAAGVVTVMGLERAEVDGDVVYLGKISRIWGEDSSLVEKLKEIGIASAPLPGKSRTLNENYIRLRLKQARVDLSQIRLEIPQQIEVTRGFVEITKEDIKKVVSNFLYANMPWEKDKANIQDIRVTDSVILPKGVITCSVEPLANTEFKGNVPLPVHFKVNDEFQKRILVTASVEVLADVVVAKRPIRRRQQITTDDIEMREKSLAGLPSNVILDREDVLGKMAKSNIDANKVLRPDLIEFPPLVKRGDVVLIVAESSGLRITALGAVEEREGRRGERIKIENLDSKKIVYARVLDSKTVQVDF